MRIVSFLFLLFFSITTNAQKFEYIYQGVEFKCKLVKDAVTITAFSLKASHVIIPSEVVYRGVRFPVKSVDVFMNGVNYLAETLVLEDGIEEIAKYSFNEFRKLQSVTLPPSLRHIGKYAFRNNTNLKMYLASNIDEISLRDGKETWPMKGGVASPNQPLKTAKEMNEMANLDQSNIVNNTAIVSQNFVTANHDITRNVSVKSDVDVEIPVTQNKNDDTFCVIIANEHYKEVPDVDFAIRDGESFREYCICTLGIPEKHVKIYYDATFMAIRRAVNWMNKTDNVTGGHSKYILYYAGHGIPSEHDRTAYILPTDGTPKDVESCYRLGELYEKLGKMNAKSVTVFLDACFSGMKRGEDRPLVEARGVAVKVKQDILSGNVVVISATSDDQTAMAYRDKHHGLFTYYLLNKLKQSKGIVSLGELYESLSSSVKKNSWIVNEKLQTPSIIVSANLRDKWKDLKF